MKPAADLFQGERKLECIRKVLQRTQSDSPIELWNVDRAIDARFALLQGNKFVLRCAACGKGAFEIDMRLVNPLSGKLKRPKMHSDTMFGSKISMRPHRLRGIHMDRLHEPAWLVGTNAEHCDIGRPQPAFDIQKVG